MAATVSDSAPFQATARRSAQPSVAAEGGCPAHPAQAAPCCAPSRCVRSGQQYCSRQPDSPWATPSPRQASCLPAPSLPRPSRQGRRTTPCSSSKVPSPAPRSDVVCSAYARSVVMPRLRCRCPTRWDTDAQTFSLDTHNAHCAGTLTLDADDFQPQINIYNHTVTIYSGATTLIVYHHMRPSMLKHLRGASPSSCCARPAQRLRKLSIARQRLDADHWPFLPVPRNRSPSIALYCLMHTSI